MKKSKTALKLDIIEVSIKKTKGFN